MKRKLIEVPGGTFDPTPPKAIRVDYQGHRYSWDSRKRKYTVTYDEDYWDEYERGKFFKRRRTVYKELPPEIQEQFRPGTTTPRPNLARTRVSGPRHFFAEASAAVLGFIAADLPGAAFAVEKTHEFMEVDDENSFPQKNVLPPQNDSKASVSSKTLSSSLSKALSVKKSFPMIEQHATSRTVKGEMWLSHNRVPYSPNNQIIQRWTTVGSTANWHDFGLQYGTDLYAWFTKDWFTQDITATNRLNPYGFVNNLFGYDLYQATTGGTVIGAIGANELKNDVIHIHNIDSYHIFKNLNTTTAADCTVTWYIAKRDMAFTSGDLSPKLITPWVAFEQANYTDGANQTTATVTGVPGAVSINPGKPFVEANLDPKYGTWGGKAPYAMSPSSLKLFNMQFRKLKQHTFILQPGQEEKILLKTHVNKTFHKEYYKFTGPFFNYNNTSVYCTIRVRPGLVAVSNEGNTVIEPTSGNPNVVWNVHHAITMTPAGTKKGRYQRAMMNNVVGLQVVNPQDINDVDTNVVPVNIEA